MGGLDLAGRAGRARGHRDPVEVKRDHGGLGLDAGDRKQGRIGQPLAQGAIRVSLGPTTTESEIDRFLDAWIRLSKALLKGGHGIAA